VAEIKETKTSVPLRFSSEEEFEAWCDEDVRAEYVDGEVVIHSPASRSHERLVVFLSTLIQLFADKHNLGTVFGSNFQIRLRPGLRRVPDVAFVSQTRREILQERYIDGAPDLVMEVVSPDSLVRDWREKYLEYQQAGVREYWVIDPQAQKIEVYGLKEAGYRLMPPEEGKLHSEVLPGFWLHPEWLWQDPLPNVLDVAREWELF